MKAKLWSLLRISIFWSLDSRVSIEVSSKASNEATDNASGGGGSGFGGSEPLFFELQTGNEVTLLLWNRQNMTTLY